MVFFGKRSYQEEDILYPIISSTLHEIWDGKRIFFRNHRYHNTTVAIGQEMIKERDNLEKKIGVMEQNISKARAVQNYNPKEDTWGKSHSQWDCYKDTDEFKCMVDHAKQDLAKLNDRIKNHNTNKSGKLCTHRYQCFCSGNKSAEREVMAVKTSVMKERNTRIH